MNIACPNCRQIVAVSPGQVGRELICPYCGGRFKTESPSSAPPPMPPPAQFSAGSQSYEYQPSRPSGQEVSPRILQQLRETRPWVMFLGILGIIGASLGALGALLTILGAAGDPVSAVAGGVQLLVAGISIIIPIVTLRYGSAIRTLVLFPNENSLESAMGAQKSYWQITGIFALIGLILVVLAFIIVIVIAGSMAANMPRHF